MVIIDGFIFQCWEDRDGRKKMNKINAKSLTTLRQKLKKYTRDFEKELEDYKENPDASEDELDAGEGMSLSSNFFSSFLALVKGPFPIKDIFLQFST